MGILVYECYNEYNGDNVKFLRQSNGSLCISESNGCNNPIEQIFTVEINKEDVQGLIDFLKNQFNIE